ncbi:MAG: hypothetical protein ABL907_04360, partial [Hyphomicrobium sp.]
RGRRARLLRHRLSCLRGNAGNLGSRSRRLIERLGCGPTQTATLKSCRGRSVLTLGASPDHAKTPSKRYAQVRILHAGAGVRKAGLSPLELFEIWLAEACRPATAPRLAGEISPFWFLAILSTPTPLGLLPAACINYAQVAWQRQKCLWSDILQNANFL